MANICVGEGWRQLVDPVLARLKADGGDIVLIKEKLGALRIFAKGASDRTRQLIARMEDLSRFTCERCGDTGKLRLDQLWRKTLCDYCDANQVCNYCNRKKIQGHNDTCINDPGKGYW